MADSPLRLLVLTSSFPFGSGEEFLEAEAGHWPVDELDICVVPIGAPGAARPMPPGVGVDSRLAGYRTKWRKVAAMVLATMHVLLVREVAILARSRRLTVGRVRSCVAVVGQTLLIRHGLRRILAGSEGNVVVYAYWHSPGAYAAVLLKRSGHVRSVVARGHRGDIYEEVAPAGWLPLKRQLFSDIDHTWTVSDDGARELAATFHGDVDRISVARLGVDLPRGPLPEPTSDCFRVLSISTCTPLKQVPLIAGAVARLASTHPDEEIEWSHLGDGPGLALLQEQVESLLSTRNNLSCRLPGHIDHPALLGLLGDRGFDVLVNASISEGVPVSIMEAMAHGIPAIAPDVGGIRELVGQVNGWLLPRHVSDRYLDAALESALADRGSSSRRSRARERIASRFDAHANYRRFADELLTQARHDSG